MSDDSSNIWIFVIVMIIILIIAIVIILVVLPSDDDSQPEPEPQPTNVENIKVGNTTVTNHIFRNVGIKISQGPFIITDLEGNLTTSWVNTREWICQGLRVYSINHPNLTLTLDEKLDENGNVQREQGDMITVSLQPYVENDSLQRFYSDGSNIIYYGYYEKSGSETVNLANLYGLAIIWGKFTDKYATFTTEDVTLEDTISFNGIIYDLQNLTMAHLDPDYDVVKYFAIEPSNDLVHIWNSGLRRITSSFGGVLSLADENENTRVIFVAPNPADKKQNSVVINGCVYFLGDNINFCHILVDNGGELGAVRIKTDQLLENTENIPNRVIIE